MWQRGTCMVKGGLFVAKGGVYGKGGMHAGKTATEAGSTHPTGIHSYYDFFLVPGHLKLFVTSLDELPTFKT